MKTIYLVKESIIGSGRIENMYFRTMAEAEEYHQKHDRTDAPEKVERNKEEAEELIRITREDIYITKFENGKEV